VVATSYSFQETSTLFIYDTMRKKSLTWIQKLSDQLNLAHVAGKNWKRWN